MYVHNCLSNIRRFFITIPCVRNIGLPNACINIFAQKYYSLGTYKQVPKELTRPLKDCKKWIADNKDSKMWKKCLAQGSR